MRSHCRIGFLCLLTAVYFVAPRAADAGSRLLDFQDLYEYLGVLTTGDSLQSPTSTAGDYVLHDQESWCAFWQTAVRAPFSCPEVDFRHETVIASIAGPQPNSCYGIGIGAIERFPRRAVDVTVLHTVPTSQCSATFNNPVAIVVVAGRIGSVEFAHEYVPDACGFGGGDVQTQCIPTWP